MGIQRLTGWLAQAWAFSGAWERGTVQLRVRCASSLNGNLKVTLLDLSEGHLTSVPPSRLMNPLFDQEAAPGVRFPGLES